MFILMKIQTDTDWKNRGSCGVELIEQHSSKEVLLDKAKSLCRKEYQELDCEHTYRLMNNGYTISATYCDGGSGCISYEVKPLPPIKDTAPTLEQVLSVMTEEDAISFVETELSCRDVWVVSRDGVPLDLPEKPEHDAVLLTVEDGKVVGVTYD